MTKTRKIVVSVSVIAIIVIIVVSAITINTNQQYTQKMKQADALVVSGKYNDAVTVYGQVLKIKSNAEVQTKLDKTLVLKKSADDFNDGMNDFKALDYNLAITSFQSVIKEDSKDYTIAVDKIKQCIKKENESAIKQAQESASNKDYATAVADINAELLVDANNQQLLDLSAKYNNEWSIAEADAKTKAKAEADARAKAKADATALASADAKARTEGVRIGMTTQECINSTWGRPDSINRTTTAYGISEQWVYNNTNYLYFDNGILTNIQN
ncbi:MAG TPA: hypothetical protein VIM42_05810 [Clostridium sp.]